MSNVLLNLVKKLTYFLEGTGIGKIKPLFKIYALVISTLKPKIVVTEGSRMILDKTDSLLLSVYPNFEPAETKLIKKYVKKGMRVVDAGAYIGYFTLLMSRLVGKDGQVHAFEPGRENFELLVKNIRLNGYSNIFANRVALSNKKGRVKLFLSSDNPQDHRIMPDRPTKHFEIVQTASLDNYFSKNKKVDFIKMDIQGSEVLALEGAKKIIAANKRMKMIVEFWPYALKKAGYDPKVIFTTYRKLGMVMLINEQNGNLVKNYNLDFSGSSEQALYNLFIEVK